MVAPTRGSMKRSNVVRYGLAIVLAGSSVALWAGGGPRVSAQGVPPSLPMTVYGEAPGGSSGQAIVAFIDGAVGTATCGAGKVVDSSGPKYVVSVLHETARPGCGTSGATVGFYLAPASAGEAGRKSNTTTTWESGGKSANLTFGDPLTIRSYMPTVASDRAPF